MENKKILETRKKILVIDNQWDTPLFVALEQEGHEVIACESPQKAWGLVWPFQPHFIIVRFPNLSKRDIATLQGCRALAGGVPIIIATSIPGNEVVVKALEEGATALLPLPVNPQAIRKVLDELEPSVVSNY